MRWQKKEAQVGNCRDQNWLNKVAEVVGHVIPGNMKSFKCAESATGKDWVSV